MKQFIAPIEMRIFFDSDKAELQKRDIYSAIMSGRKHISEYDPVVINTIKEDLLSFFEDKPVDFDIINIELTLNSAQRDIVEQGTDENESFASFIGQVRISVPSHYTSAYIDYLFADLWSDSAALIEPKKDDALTKDILSRLSLRNKEQGFKFVDIWCWDLVDAKKTEIALA